MAQAALQLAALLLTHSTCCTSTQRSRLAACELAQLAASGHTLLQWPHLAANFGCLFADLPLPACLLADLPLPACLLSSILFFSQVTERLTERVGERVSYTATNTQQEQCAGLVLERCTFCSSVLS
jgi:hypothetical protein